MPIQTDYPYTYGKLLVGMGYDLRPKTDTTAAATVPIEFGSGLVHDSSQGLSEGRVSVKLPSAAADIFAGIALYEHKQNTTGTVATITDLTTTEGSRYEAKEPITVRTKGSVVVYSEQAVKPGDPVFMRHAVGGAGTAPGQFRKDADSNSAIAIPNARWIGRSTAAGSVALEVNLP